MRAGCMRFSIVDCQSTICDSRSATRASTDFSIEDAENAEDSGRPGALAETSAPRLAHRCKNFGYLKGGPAEAKLTGMKPSRIGVLLFIASMILSASAQDKPRVFVQGKGSEDTQATSSWGGLRQTTDSHDESMEVTKDLQKNCGGVIVTLNQANADYTVMLNRESKKNRGLLRSNSQLQVANHDGDVIGTNATHTVGNAAKDACQLIVADWQAHPRQPAAANPAPAVQPAVAQQPAQFVPVSAPASQTQSDSPAATSGTTSTDSPADAAKKAKQHAACLQLAKDNPSITCN